jgi:hypothetical protein
MGRGKKAYIGEEEQTGKRQGAQAQAQAQAAAQAQALVFAEFTFFTTMSSAG